MYISIWRRNLKEKDQLEDLSIDRKVALKEF
jgi:hypothetical protein